MANYQAMSENTHKIYRKARFTISAPTIKSLPADEGFEVAFAGRSNAGKSSAINALTGSKKTARVSKTPGRTQGINYFALDDERNLVDLPGYGYAKVPERIRKQWAGLLENYLSKRQSLRGVVLVMDVRRPFADFDDSMLRWCSHFGTPLHILLTKADKLSKNQAGATLQKAKATLNELSNSHHPPFTVQLYSSLKGTGVQELQQRLDNWLSLI